MLKMLFLALAVVVLLPPSVPACEYENINRCIHTKEHALYLFGSVPANLNFQLDLLKVLIITFNIDAYAEIEKIHTNEDGTISIYLTFKCFWAVDGSLAKGDGIGRISIIINGAIVDGRYLIGSITTLLILEGYNLNLLGIAAVSADKLEAGIKAHLEALIAQNRDSYWKYLQDCFDKNAVCVTPI